MNINPEAFTAVADAIAAETDRFDLAIFCEGLTFGTHCGTAACVAGWANLLASGRDAISENEAGDTNTAARFLLAESHDDAEVRANLALRLFYADSGSVWVEQAWRFGWAVDGVNYQLDDWSDVTGEQAVIVLREIANGTIEL